MLRLSTSRFVVEDGHLWDGDECVGPFIELPATDQDVQRDINALLVSHQQRDLPPEKPKRAAKKKKDEKDASQTAET